MRGILALFVAALLAGCAIGPDYKRPEVSLSDAKNFSSAGLDQEFNPSEEIVGWWHSFNDPLLNKLIEESVAGNRDVERGFNKVLESRAMRREAFNDLFPGARSFAEHTSQRFSDEDQQGGDFGKTSEYFSVGFDALWEIDLFGTQRRLVEQKHAEEDADQAALDGMLASVTAEVAMVYFELRGLQKRLAVARSNAQNQKSTAGLVTSMVEAGRGTELDRARAFAQLARTEATVPDLEASERVAMHRLAVLTGKEPSALLFELKEPKDLPNYSGPVSIGSPELMLRRRPDVRVAERLLAASNAGIGVAYGDLFPKVSFSGLISLESNSFNRLGDSGTTGYTYGPRISWIALDIGRIIQRIHAADSRFEQSLSAYHQAVLLALEDTENSLVRFSKEKQRKDFLQDAALNSKRAAELASLQYKDGLIDLLAVLEAEGDALQDEDAFVQSETLALSSLVGIYKALGGGWTGQYLEERKEG